MAVFRALEAEIRAAARVAVMAVVVLVVVAVVVVALVDRPRPPAVAPCPPGACVLHVHRAAP